MNSTMLKASHAGFGCGGRREWRQSLSRVVLMLILASIVPRAHAQESPSIFVEKFDTSVSYRTDVCDRQRLVWSGTLALPDALRGLNLTTVHTNYREPDEDKYFTLVNNKIPELNPGLFAVILDEVAARAGFSWRDSFAVASPLSLEDDKGKTWTDILLWGVQTFDISVEKWGKSIERMELGVSYPAGWWDSSIVLVELAGPNSERETFQLDLWSFLRPFRGSVWGGIAGTIILTGLLYWFLEYLDVDADERDLEHRPMSSIFYAAMVCIGHLEFRPNTDAARIVVWSWTFWTVIVASAYTANMASFLVSKNVQTFNIASIESAIQRNARICVQNGGVVGTLLEKNYGNSAVGTLQLVQRDSEAAIFNGLRDGSCEVAAHQMNTLRIFERSVVTNSDCALESNERVVIPIPAGMATTIDTGVDKCSSLISHVLDFYLTEMIEDGFVEQAWKTHLNRVGTIECISPPPRGTDFGGDTFSLGLRDVGGIFILHAIVLLVSFAISVTQFYSNNTSNNSMSQVFFVTQAKEEFKRRRESIRASLAGRVPVDVPEGSGNTDNSPPSRNDFAAKDQTIGFDLPLNNSLELLVEEDDDSSQAI